MNNTRNIDDFVKQKFIPGTLFTWMNYVTSTPEIGMLIGWDGDGAIILFNGTIEIRNLRIIYEFQWANVCS